MHVFARKKIRPKGRWDQDVIDEVQMHASEAGHLAYNRQIFRKAVMGAKLRKGHATE